MPATASAQSVAWIASASSGVAAQLASRFSVKGAKTPEPGQIRVLAPFRQEVVESAMEMADQMVDAQYDFIRKVVRSAGKSLSAHPEATAGYGRTGRAL